MSSFAASHCFLDRNIKLARASPVPISSQRRTDAVCTTRATFDRTLEAGLLPQPEMRLIYSFTTDEAELR